MNRSKKPQILSRRQSNDREQTILDSIHYSDDYYFPIHGRYRTFAFSIMGNYYDFYSWNYNLKLPDAIDSGNSINCRKLANS